MKKLYLKSIAIYLFLVLFSLIGSKVIDAGNTYQDFIEKGDFVEMSFLFILGSIIETFIFSFLAIYLLKKIKKSFLNDFYIILISSIFFGLGHFSSLTFFIITFIVGICFNYNFLTYYNFTKNYKIAFFTTFLIHFFTNYTTYLIDINF